MLPQISVVMPVRDGAATLMECLNSLLAQTFMDWELVLVDDGSLDASSRIAAHFAGRDTRVRVLRTSGVGIPLALNYGLQACRAPLVARMDADDRMHPRRLELQAAGFQRWPHCDVLGSRVSLFPESAVAGGMREYMAWQNACTSPAQLHADIYWEAPFVHPSVSFKRKVVLDAGAYRDGDFPEDYELWLRLNSVGARFAKLKSTLLEWRVHEQSTSRRDGRYRREAFDTVRFEYLRNDGRLTKASELVVWGAGRATRKRLRGLLERSPKLAAWIDIDKRKIGNMVNGVQVHAPSWLRYRRPKPFVLACVTSHGARKAISRYLQQCGFVPGADFLCVG